MSRAPTWDSRYPSTDPLSQRRPPPHVYPYPSIHSTPPLPFHPRGPGPSFNGGGQYGPIGQGLAPTLNQSFSRLGQPVSLLQPNPITPQGSQFVQQPTPPATPQQSAEISVAVESRVASSVESPTSSSKHKPSSRSSNLVPPFLGLSGTLSLSHTSTTTN